MAAQTFPRRHARASALQNVLAEVNSLLASTPGIPTDPRSVGYEAMIVPRVRIPPVWQTVRCPRV
jgi:hypothetical protein